MSQLSGSDGVKKPNGPTRWQVTLCTVLVFGLVSALLVAFGNAVSGRVKKATATDFADQLTGSLGLKAQSGKPAEKPLIESETKVASLGVGIVREVAKAKSGVTLVRISFMHKSGVFFGAIAGEGEWKEGDRCTLVMLKYSSYSAFPSSPEYIAVKTTQVEVDGYP